MGIKSKKSITALILAKGHKGIPDDIQLNRFDHHEPYKGDNGIGFESVEVEEG